MKNKPAYGESDCMGSRFASRSALWVVTGGRDLVGKSQKVNNAFGADCPLRAG